ncbi:MAG: hypothetical protein DRI90_24775 [Deltaproteobacteria bacterium]|nr:MAG: hypothetical protein DRI90_24775 [Deltaproteobacteria bacterium]
MNDQPDQLDGTGRPTRSQPETDTGTAEDRSNRDAAVAQVLAGADEQTRRNLQPMLSRSSVLETIASVHGSDEPLMIEDRPAKPDFLNTEEYAIARKAIGATGKPSPGRAEEKAAAIPAARPATGRLGLWIVIGLLAVAILVLWLRGVPSDEVEPRSGTADPSATSPSPTVSQGASSTAGLSTPQSAAPSTAPDSTATETSTAASKHPTARPPTPATTALPHPSVSASRPPPAPSRSSDLLFPPKE